MSVDPGTDRVRIRRNARRASYDPDVVRSILDANQVCHVAYVEEGEPRLVPMLYMRRDDHLYLHGNRQAAVLRHLADGGLAAVSVMCLDGVVVARSGFHCSMNYRSVVLFGRGEPVPVEEHESVLDAFVAALIPGHEQRVRRATPQELNATAAVRLPIDEAAAKIRTGGAIDDADDLHSDVWAGILPLAIQAGTPVPNDDLDSGIPVPDYIRTYQPPA